MQPSEVSIEACLSAFTLALYWSHWITFNTATNHSPRQVLTVNKLWDSRRRLHRLLFVFQITDWSIRPIGFTVDRRLKATRKKSSMHERKLFLGFYFFFVIHHVRMSLANNTQMDVKSHGRLIRTWKWEMSSSAPNYGFIEYLIYACTLSRVPDTLCGVPCARHRLRNGNELV